MSRFPAYPLEDYRHHQSGIDEALRKMLSGGHYILGGEVAAFEREFADFVGVRQSIGVANGTDAIELILRALDIGPGCKVAVPSHTAVASASAVGRAGAEVVFVDIDPDTFTMCPTSLEGLLESENGKGVRAVLAVHIYGHPADWIALQKVCEAHDVTLLEDCAQAHGAVWDGRKVGSLGLAAAFSFYPTKNLGAIGDGGGITTDNEELAERIRCIRQYGWRERYISDCEGVNSRLDEMQAAILRVKLRTLDEQLTSRRRLAAAYGKGLADAAGVTVPLCKLGAEHAYHLYVIKSPFRNALMKHLEALKIPVALHYPAAIHQQPGYHSRIAHSAPLPNTEKIVGEILSLPLHPYLPPESVTEVCEGILSFKP